MTSLFSATLVTMALFFAASSTPRIVFYALDAMRDRGDTASGGRKFNKRQLAGGGRVVAPPSILQVPHAMADVIPA